MSLEQRLHEKYRLELSARERAFRIIADYKENLEKFLLLLLFVISGFQFLATQYTVISAPPLYITGLRFLAGGLIFFLVFFRELIAGFKWSDVRDLLGPVTLYRIIGLGGVSFALKTIPTGASSVILGSSVLFIYVLNIMKGSEKASSKAFAGIFLGIGGLALVLGGGVAKPGMALGYAVMVLATILYSLGVFWRPKNLPVGVMAYELIFSGLCLVLLSYFFENPESFSFFLMPKEALVGFIYLLIFLTLIADPAFVWLSSQTTSVKANSFVFVRPLIAVAVGWVVAGEKLSFGTAAGILLVLFSLYVILKKTRKD